MADQPTEFAIRNHEPELCELDVSETQGGDESLIPLNIEVTFGPAQIHTDRVSIKFAITKAIVRVNVENGEIARKTKFGNNQRENVVNVGKEFGAELGVGSEQERTGSLGLFGGGVRAGVGTRAQARRAARKSQTEIFDQKLERVLALPDGKWQVQEVRGSCLMGRYLGDENICDLQIDREFGMVHVEVFFDINDLIVLSCVDATGGTARPINDAQVRAVSEALVKRDLRRTGSEFTVSDASIHRPD